MMYHIMWKNKNIADVDLNLDKKHIHMKKYDTGTRIQFFPGDSITIYQFYAFLKSRCYEDDRADLKDILKQAEMESNNPYEWVKLTHGVTWEDYMWIKFDNEDITWEEVRIRE